MKLSKLEEDLLGDLAQDDHGLCEVFQFARLHHPGEPDSRVFEIGRQLLQSWSARGWLEIVSETGQVLSRNSLRELLAQLDTRATEPFDGAPRLRLTRAASRDVGWLPEAT